MSRCNTVAPVRSAADGGTALVTQAIRTAWIAVVLGCLALPARAETVTLFEGALSFDLPPEVRHMTPEEMAIKFPAGTVQPDIAFTATESLSVTVSAMHLAVFGPPLPPMEEYLEAFSASIAHAIPDLSWEQRAVETINGREWVRVEYTAEWHGQPTYWVVMGHPVEGAFYGIRCSAAIPDREDFEPVFDDIVATLRLAL